MPGASMRWKESDGQERRPHTVQSEGALNKMKVSSTPLSFSRTTPHVSSSAKIRRPKTAAAVLGRSTDCARVLQLEHEPTRCQNLESHLAPKRSKPPPWQKNLEPPLVPFVCGPGYILSRSKSKYALTIKDEFFDTSPEAEFKKKSGDHERDSLVAQLQEQISDLTLFLEEERLNHRQTKQRAEEHLQDRLEQSESQHNDNIRELQREHKAAMKNQKAEQESNFSEYQTTAENQIQKLTKEVEFLQGAFDSYKTTLHVEMHDKWKAKEEELRQQNEEAKQAAIHELKTQLIKEKHADKTGQAKEHHRALEALRKEHKKDLDALVRKFSNAAADLERLQRTTAELEEAKTELQQIKESYDETCQQLANTTRNLTDAKVRLMEFEQKFQEKVSEVDDKYRARLQDLMTQNTELRRLFVQKCGQLFDEKSLTDHRTMEEAKTAKETLESLIRTRHRANVSMAMIPDVASSARHSCPLSRPASAPGTRQEAQVAYQGAGDTDHLVQHQQFIRPDHIIPPEDPEREKIRQELLATDIRHFTKEDLLNTFAL